MLTIIEIMLRNIPNKVDQVQTQLLLCIHEYWMEQPMLKEIIDETSYGKYDFMYLRIGRQILGRSLRRQTNNGFRLCEQLQVGSIYSPGRSLEANIESVGYAFINFEDVCVPLLNSIKLCWQLPSQPTLST